MTGTARVNGHLIAIPDGKKKQERKRRESERGWLFAFYVTTKAVL